MLGGEFKTWGGGDFPPLKSLKKTLVGKSEPLTIPHYVSITSREMSSRVTHIYFYFQERK